MKGYSSMAEAAVALIGQVGGGLPTPEAAAGPMGKGITWGARFISGAWRQGAVNAVVNPAVQALAIAGGGQEKYDPWQHAMSVGVGAIAGGAGSALFGRRLVPTAGEVSAPASHAPEGLPAGVRGEEAAVAPKPIAPDVAPQEVPASPRLPGEKEPAHASTGTSGQPGELARFDTFELGSGDRSSNRKIVQGESDVNALREGALQRKPILENDLQRIASGIDGAQFVSARVKDAPGLAEKVATGRPAHTIGDYLGGRISVESPAALKRAREEIERIYRVLEVDDKIAKPKSGGYRAIHMQVDLGNGMSAEIQLVPSEIAKVMDSTHGIYDKYKRLKVGEMTDDIKAAYNADMDRIRSIHDSAWEKQMKLGWPRQ
jgi:ppGpp synthetase/RelA/SpoT-type nucleotidyltranferase